MTGERRKNDFLCAAGTIHPLVEIGGPQNKGKNNYIDSKILAKLLQICCYLS